MLSFRGKRVLLVCVFLLAGLAFVRGLSSAQDTPERIQVSPTSNVVDIPTSTALASPTPAATQPPPTFTPTNQGPPQISISADSGNINARAEPDPSSQVVGSLGPGELYPITGRFFMWLRFAYPSSPSGQAYVFGDLVTVVGDPARIPDLTVEDPLEAGAGEATAEVVNETATIQALEGTPGFDLTLTADTRGEIEAPSGGAEGSVDGTVAPDGANFGVQPTFTYPFTPSPPAEGVAAEVTLAPQQANNTEEGGGLAPIVPIVAFAVIGLIGLLLSLLQR